MSTILYKNTTIHYRVFGNGNPLVFLHGFIEDSSMWDDFIKPFISKNKVILIDLPCHGKTRFKGDVCSMQFMAECVQAVLKKENIKKPKVFGHSMGGYVGLELLKLTPINLTLVHSNFWSDSTEKQADRDRVVDVVKQKKEFFIQEAIPNLFYSQNIKMCETPITQLIKKANLIPQNEICAATLGMKTRHDNSHLLDSNQIQIIQGQFDPIITSTQLSEQLNSIEHQSQTHTIKNCGHMSIWEKPKELLKIMKQISN